MKILLNVRPNVYMHRKKKKNCIPTTKGLLQRDKKILKLRIAIILFAILEFLSCAFGACSLLISRIQFCQCAALSLLSLRNRASSFTYFVPFFRSPASVKEKGLLDTLLARVASNATKSSSPRNNFAYLLRLIILSRTIAKGSGERIRVYICMYIHMSLCVCIYIYLYSIFYCYTIVLL